MELRLADVESVISSRDKEIADLKVALTEREDKFYNMGFMDVENSSEPVMFQSWRFSFGDGWLATVSAMGVPEDSPFRNAEQIPYSERLPPLV